MVQQYLQEMVLERFKEAGSNALKSQFYQIVIRTGGSKLMILMLVVDLDNTSITFATSALVALMI